MDGIMDGMWMSDCAPETPVHEKKTRVKCICLHAPVGYNGSLSTVNETNCNKKEDQFKNSYELISNSIQTCPTTMCLKKNAIDCIDLDG